MRISKGEGRKARKGRRSVGGGGERLFWRKYNGKHAR